MTKIIGTSLDLTPDPVTENGVTVFTNNVSAIEQLDKEGNMQNLLYLDGDDNMFFGPLRAPHIQMFTTTPLNLTVRHIHWDFNETQIPPGLDLIQIGHTGSYNFSKEDSRISLCTAAVASSDGIALQANNVLTKTDRHTQIYFTIDLDGEDRNSDLQWGVRSKDGGNAINFRYAAASNAHSVITAMLYNGTQHSVVTTSNDIGGRHLYCIEWEANGNINFWIGNSINNLKLAVTFAANDSAKPSALAKLVPFVQMRTNDVAQVRTCVLDTIYAIFAW